jgi:hypothetical protein
LLAAANRAPGEAEARAYDEFATGPGDRRHVNRSAAWTSAVEQGGGRSGLLVRTPIRSTAANIHFSVTCAAQASTPAVPDGPRLIRLTFAVMLHLQAATKQ